MWASASGNTVGSSGRMVIPYGEQAPMPMAIPRSVPQPYGFGRLPAVTAKADTQFQHVYHVATADNILEARAARNVDSPWPVPNLTSESKREFPNELFFILPYNGKGARNLPHNNGPQVRGYISFANMTWEEAEEAELGGIVTTQAARADDHGMGYGGTDDMWVGALVQIGDVPHRYAGKIEAGDALVWDYPVVVNDPTNERGKINALPAQGMDPRTITPVIRPLRSIYGSFATFSHFMAAVFNGHVPQQDVSHRVPVIQSTESAKFVSDQLPELLIRAGITGLEVADAIRRHCYLNRQRQKEAENMMILDDLAALGAADHSKILKLVLQWNAIHFTALADAQNDWIRRHYVGTALSNSYMGKVTTINLRG